VLDERFVYLTLLLNLVGAARQRDLRRASAT